MIENVSTVRIENRISVYENIQRDANNASILLQYEAAVMTDTLKAELIRRQREEAIEVMTEHIWPYLNMVVITMMRAGIDSLTLYNDGSGGVGNLYVHWDDAAGGAKALAKLCVRNQNNVRNAD